MMDAWEQIIDDSGEESGNITAHSLAKGSPPSLALLRLQISVQAPECKMHITAPRHLLAQPKAAPPEHKQKDRPDNRGTTRRARFPV